MADIYSHAYLTICALTSADGTGLCSTSFKPTLVDSACQVSDRVYAYHGAVRPCAGPEGAAQTRAWIMQEELLSRRRLYCGLQRVTWVCRTMYSRHDMPWAALIPKNLAFRSTFVNPFEPSLVTATEADSQWRALVTAYSHRELSYATDRLPALSAVARRFGQSASYEESDYLGGLGRQHLPKSLLWAHTIAWTEEERQSAAVGTELAPSVEMAPSWSWASRSGPIEFFDHHADHRAPKIYDPGDPGLQSCRVLGASTVLKTLNRFGEVESGRLRLRGRALLDPSPAIWNFGPDDVRHGLIGLGLDGSVDNLQGCIMMQVDPHGGLLLREIATPGARTPVFKRVGIAVLDRKFTWGSGFTDGEWRTMTVEVV